MDAGVRPPVPVADPDSAPFWAATARHELRLPSCARCHRLLYPPAPRCPACLEPVTEWRTLSGRGVLHGWTVVHAALVPGLDVPYTVAEVELAEQPGLLLTTTVVEDDPASLHVGTPVEVAWTDLDDAGVSLPRFRVAGPR